MHDELLGKKAGERFGVKNPRMSTTDPSEVKSVPCELMVKQGIDELHCRLRGSEGVLEPMLNALYAASVRGRQGESLLALNKVVVAHIRSELPTVSRSR